MNEKMYHELASWWPLLSAPEEYEEEANVYARLLEESCAYAPRSLLELGSGGGNHAWHLKGSFELTLVDPSTEMLAIRRALNPECEHLEGDMRTLRLDRVARTGRCGLNTTDMSKGCFPGRHGWA